MPSNIIDKKTGMPMNFVDIAGGLYRSAEAIYDSIVKKMMKRIKKSKIIEIIKEVIKMIKVVQMMKEIIIRIIRIV